MSKIIWLDLPNPHSDLTDPENPWVNYTTFHGPNAKQEAIAFIREHIDPNCDDEGRINLLTEGDDGEKEVEDE